MEAPGPGASERGDCLVVDPVLCSISDRFLRSVDRWSGEGIRTGWRGYLGERGESVSLRYLSLVEVLRYWEAEGALEGFEEHVVSQGWTAPDPQAVVSIFREARALARTVPIGAWERSLEAAGSGQLEVPFLWWFLIGLEEGWGCEGDDRSDFLHRLASTTTPEQERIQILLDTPLCGAVPDPIPELALLPAEARGRIRSAVHAVICRLGDENQQRRVLVRYGPVQSEALTVVLVAEACGVRCRDLELARSALGHIEGGPELAVRLANLPLPRRLAALRLVRPGLRAAIRATLSLDPGVQELVEFLLGPWLPVRPVPRGLDGEFLSALRHLAHADPGTHTGPRPAEGAKLARLVLSAHVFWPAEQVVEWALAAYDDAPGYHAHEAVACALVHPGVEEKQSLVELIYENARERQGWRSRRKLNRILLWAAERGWIRRPWN